MTDILKGKIDEAMNKFKEMPCSRALRGEDKVAFDNLINEAREHASSCTDPPMLETKDAVFLSILMEM